MIIKSGYGWANLSGATLPEVLSYVAAQTTVNSEQQQALIRSGFAKWQAKQDARSQRVDAKHVAKR